MEEYLVPTQYAQDEFVEKKCRRIGRSGTVASHTEPLWQGEEMTKYHDDALRNWRAYVHADVGVFFWVDVEPGATDGDLKSQVLK